MPPTCAMVLAAGLGTRMRPITDRLPKPLVEVGGRTLLDRGLDALRAAGVTRAVVNVHHLADQIEEHVAKIPDLAIAVSDERGGLLDSGGGIVKALPLLGPQPFFVLNADTFWVEGNAGAPSSLRRLATAFDPARMDMILLLADPRHATGHTGGGDFTMDGDGRLRRFRGEGTAFIYAGALIVSPPVFADAPAGAFSLNRHFDGAIAAGRLFGLPLAGHWITVGTPGAIGEAEAVLAGLEARR